MKFENPLNFSPYHKSYKQLLDFCNSNGFRMNFHWNIHGLEGNVTTYIWLRITVLYKYWDKQRTIRKNKIETLYCSSKLYYSEDIQMMQEELSKEALEYFHRTIDQKSVKFLEEKLETGHMSGPCNVDNTQGFNFDNKQSFADALLSDKSDPALPLTTSLDPTKLSIAKLDQNSKKFLKIDKLKSKNKVSDNSKMQKSEILQSMIDNKGCFSESTFTIQDCLRTQFPTIITQWSEMSEVKEDD